MFHALQRPGINDPRENRICAIREFRKKIKGDIVMKKTDLKKKTEAQRKAKPLSRKTLKEWCDPTCTPMNITK